MVLQLTKTGSQYNGAVVAGASHNGVGPNAKVNLSWGYGKVETRMKVTPGKGGFWQIFWMLGADFPQVSWPASGEIDTAEFFYPNGQTDHYYATMHNPGSGGTDSYTGTQAYVPASLVGATDFSNDYHTYWVTRAYNSLTVGVDSKTIATWTPANLPSGTTWAFNQPFFPLFFFLLTNASTPPSGAAPAQMLVDWIRFTPAS